MARILFILIAVTASATAALAEPTACDLLATHPLDPDKITAGVSGSVVRKDLDTAIAVCRTDVARFPDNPRLTYNLGRVLFYDQKFAEGLKYIDKAAAAGHRQSQFVAGLIYSRGSGGTAIDRCRGFNHWLTAARGGHYGATLTLAQRYLAGRDTKLPGLVLERRCRRWWTEPASNPTRTTISMACCLPPWMPG